MDDGTREIRPSGALGTAPFEEEFLFHLSRGSEYLVENHVERAKEELERALRYQPHDGKGQDLLASVYFRLGLHPRAIEIWTRLSRAHPNDLALRVNLGLVLLKTGQPEEARLNFLRATEIDPKHARAYRYLGLAEWRCGNLDQARESFLRGGEVTMARRMEEMLGEVPDAAPTASTGAPDAAGAAERAEVPSAATDALERFASETTPLAVDVHTERLEEQPVPNTLARHLDAWSVAVEHGPSLCVAANGLLVITTRAPVVFRNERMRVAWGPVVVEPVLRRARQDGDGAVAPGGDAALVRANAGLHALIAPADGLRFVAIALADEALFVTERALEAFDGSLVHEHNRLDSDLDMVSVRGIGIVVLRLRCEPSALVVRDGGLAHVHRDALVGWTGRLFPADRSAVSVSGMLAFRGEGTLLVN